VRSLGAVVTAVVICALALPSAAAAALPPVGHVFVIVLENKSFADSFGPTGQVNAPYLNGTLVPKGELLTQYYGIGHNSADNYIAMISGQPPTPASKNDCPDPLQPVADEAVAPYGIAKSDGCVYPARFKTIGDQLTGHGLTWKGYNSGIPSPCSLLSSNPAPGTHYERKHNPWVFFRSLRDSGQCQANDVGLDQLPSDLHSVDTTPNLSYIVPDQCEDAHDDCTGPLPDPVSGDQFALQQADAFLAKWVPQILASPAYKQDGLLVVTFDESVGDATACCNEQPGPADPNPGGYVNGMPGPGGGLTGTVLVSKFISPGSAQPSGRHLNSNPYNHYSLLRSIEKLFGIKPFLGYAGQTGLVGFGNDVFDRVPAPGTSGSPAGGSGGSPGSQGGGNTAAQGMLGKRNAASCARAPRSVFRTTGRRHKLRVSGRTTSACRSAVRVIQVGVARRAHGRCRWLTAAGRTRRATSCGRPLWLLARGRGRSWSIVLRHVPQGRYLVRVRAIDVKGRREAPRGRTVAVHAK
jgi:hypothetical protein